MATAKGYFFLGGRRIPSGITAVGQGAECPPNTSHQEISGDLLVRGKEWQKKKGGNGEEKNENLEREGGKLNGRRKIYKMRRGPLLFFFLFFFFSFHF